MGISRPVLGFPSRTEAVVTLVSQGVRPREIARRISLECPNDPVTPSGVHSILQSVRGQVSRGNHPVPFALVIPAGCFRSLVAAGAERGIRADELARRVLTAAAGDNLIDAILDDGGDR